MDGRPVTYRIAMVAACPFPAAFASSGLIRELSLALKHQGHSVDIITYHIGDDSFSTEGLTIHRIPRIRGYRKRCSGISPGKPLLDLLLTRKLMDVCQRTPFDIIHAHNYEAPPAAYYVRRRTGIPVVYHAHNTMLHELPTYFYSKPVRVAARWIGYRLDQWIPHHADAIITVSQEQTDYLHTRGVSLERMTLIPPSIFPETMSGGDGETVRRCLGIGDSPVVIYTGGLQPYQNCGVLIDVLRHCLHRIPEMVLLILARSAPEWLKNIALAAGVFDRIHFLTGRDLAFEKDCLAAADVGIIPRSHCIGFPVKLLNYLAAGLPVVCFQGINKGFDHPNEVLAVASDQPVEMADAICRIVTESDLRSRLVRNGRKKLFDRYTWNSVISRYEAIYSSVVSVSSTWKRQ
ncbi:glycosyltransferase family 4 protein [bacterium]|nr:glycosyltransferase family 4 protein [candidate division CSSED10-310 bacterium]